MMKRDIKFRAWNVAQSSMSRPFSFYDAMDGNKPWFKGMYGETAVFMQFTGLKDKNGKEIYEGDRIKGFKRLQEDRDGKDGYWVEDVVTYHAGCMKVFSRFTAEGYTREDNTLYQFMWHEAGSFTNTRGWYYQIDEIELIGNIYENPELFSKTESNLHPVFEQALKPFVSPDLLK